MPKGNVKAYARSKNTLDHAPKTSSTHGQQRMLGSVSLSRRSAKKGKK